MQSNRISSLTRHTGRSAALTVHAALIRGDHVLDVDEGILAAVLLKQLQRLFNQITNVLFLLLCVINAITRVFWMKVL